MTQVPTENEINALVRAAREAAEELYILTRMGTRRADPVRRYRALVEALQPFAESSPSQRFTPADDSTGDSASADPR